jgi:putative oxidoreductase
MPHPLQGLLSVLGRLVLCAIFLMSAAGGHIPNYEKTIQEMTDHGVPSPQVLLPGALAFLIVGSLSVILGYKVRFGALLLLIFLALAAYYFHNFWAVEEAKKQDQVIHFMKNLSMMGAMLFIIGNGAGAWSVDAKSAKS